MLHFSTDGLSITYDADLNFRAKYQQEAQCEIALLGRGQVTGNWDFNHAKGAVNATSLPLDINLSHCEDLLDLQQELAVLRLSETWSVLSTENIQINQIRHYPTELEGIRLPWSNGYSDRHFTSES